MKKHLLALILLIIIGYQLSAQKTKDVLYLKNGSVINGTLIEINDNQYKIKTSDGSLYAYSLQEVDKYVKGTSEYDGRKTSGGGFALEAGFMIGSQGSRYVMPFSFNCIAGYNINTSNFLGLGSGVEFLGQTFTPVFFEYKYLINDNKIAPFVFMRSGYLLHVGSGSESTNDTYPVYNAEHDYKGGGSLAIGTGISWGSSDMDTYLSFAYRYARTSYKQGNATYKNNYNRLELKFGFKF
jgi:hypothetical protein